MSKPSSVFVCQSCEESYPRWQGQCNSCGGWNTLVEQALEKKTNSKFLISKRETSQKIIKFSEVGRAKATKNRFSSGIGELDRVLGGGIVPGAVILLGGEPGIGKSTLLTQLVIKLLSPQPLLDKILYVCGEESPSQISLRIARILDKEHKSSQLEQLSFITTNNVDELCLILQKEKPSLVIVDSVQSMQTEDLSGAAGSAGQIREAADRITNAAKVSNIPVFLVGHVTKDGVIAGPKILEHIVDAVLDLSGDRLGDLRVLRTLKNRFGATDEVGVFKINEFGLEEVSNPSEIFLEHGQVGVPGSAIACIMEGSRPLLIELQALVNRTNLAMPRRVGRGIELSRIQVLAAILEKHCHLSLGERDVFASAAGGFRVKEPSIDLALAIAMTSSYKEKKSPQNTIFIGEIGLLGEIRRVPFIERRIKEAKRLGYKKIISRASHQHLKNVLKELMLI